MTKPTSFTHRDLQAYLEKKAAAAKIKVGDLHKDHEWIRPVTEALDRFEADNRRRSE